MRLHFVLCLVPFCLGPALADGTIYRYVDREGTVTFTNLPLPGAVPLSPPAAADKPASRRHGNAAERVDADVQKQRDQTRRAILLQELARERQALAAARRALKHAPAGDAVPDVQAAITEHEKNIESISTELVHR